MQEYALFPTLLCSFRNQQHSLVKRQFYECAMNYFTKNGESHEQTGHVTMHHEPKLKEMYSFVIGSVLQYVNRLHIDSNLFEFNFVKSWLNVTNGMSNPQHNHRDAHISFVYYMNVPENNKRSIRFFNHVHRHEPFAGSFLFSNPTNTFDQYNSGNFMLPPEEGMLLVFPASLDHDVVGDDQLRVLKRNTIQELNKCRISVAGDILMTFKDLQAKPLGLQPITNWRRFNP